MTKHQKNTFKERTNKFIELDKEEQEKVSKMAANRFDRLVNEILNPTLGEERKQFRDGYIELFEELQATIIFLEKERDGWKDRVNKEVTKDN